MSASAQLLIVNDLIEEGKKSVNISHLSIPG